MKILDDIYTEFDQESYDETLRNDGRIEGIQIGARETAIANAKNLLKLGVSSETVAQGCSLPLEQVLTLKEELTREGVAVTN